ncbi:MAG: BrnT family toxin, partial [Vicinamibacterales bacterium]
MLPEADGKARVADSGGRGFGRVADSGIASSGASASEPTISFTHHFVPYWNDNKVARNLREHGVSFDEAETVFEDFSGVEFVDHDHSDDELRFARMALSRASGARHLAREDPRGRGAASPGPRRRGRGVRRRRRQA